MDGIKERFKENILLRLICFFVMFSLIIGGVAYLVYYGIINIVLDSLYNDIFPMYSTTEYIFTNFLTNMFAVIVIFNLSIYIIWKLTLHFSLRNFDNISNIDILKYVKIIIFVITIIIVSYLIYSTWNTTNYLNEEKESLGEFDTVYNTVREQAGGRETEEMREVYKTKQLIKESVEMSKYYNLLVNIIIIIDVIIFNIISYFIVERAYYRKYENQSW